MQLRNWLFSLFIINVVLGMTTSFSTAQTGTDPFKDAAIVWHMRSLDASEDNPLTLLVNGAATVGQKLEGDELTQSLKRGGDGFAAMLNENGWLSLDTNRTNSLHSDGEEVSLSMRVWIGPDGSGPLFFSDFLALSIHPSGLAIGFLGLKTPHGKVFREMPLAMIEKGGWLDLVIRVGGGRMDFFCNGVLKRSLEIKQALASPFDDAMAVGGFLWSGPDLHVHPVQSFRHGKVDTVALWRRRLTDHEVAFLSGNEQLHAPTPIAPVDQAMLDYTAFFDSSINKDVAGCGKLWKSLRVFTDQDPYRPTYHLTAPVGAVFDPVGAFYYGGRYHIFSYHNIQYVLKYCSLDHYVSDDLIHWSAWPYAPWADSDLDIYAIYLMNHFIDDQGVPSVIYTALGKQGKHGILARSHDGLVTYEDKHPVLTKYHHDGHVWKEGETWYTITTKMTKSTRSGNRGDGIMLWSSADLEHWQERSEIFTQPRIETSTSGCDRAGFTEFPYLLPFGDKDVLMLGSHPVRYWVGKFDRAQLKFLPDKTHGQLLDYANPFHCFNPLTVDKKGPDGASRRIIMALFGGVSGNVGGLPWECAHAMPRSLQLEGDHLRQDPLPEFEALREGHLTKQNISVAPTGKGYIDKRGDVVEISAEFEPGDARRFGLKVRVSPDGTSFARIYFDTTTQEFGIDGSVPDNHLELNLKPGQGAPTYIPKGEPVRLHVFLDKLMLEAFVNGQTCTTAAQNRQPGCDGIDLFTAGGTARCKQLDIWTLKSARLSEN